MSDAETLNELLSFLDRDGCYSAFPDEVIDVYLKRAGITTDDVKVKRLIALSAQKFVHDVAESAMHYSERQQQQQTEGDATPGASQTSQAHVLTQDVLAAALDEFGINIHQPTSRHM
eukprot:NODE_2524_length_520_cov_174.683652_g2004_i0.p1 GENE.NODE_2524_length_520_cov_174.683652_g2004_i0~~NODE_2524_length_520_cov_174.683652_g2004_i0.p1  ORF type:complete len:117 (+),score=35.48 NODE_2524_length_520_cov_174.683652_g2004_i0:64-414(+)